MTQLLEEAVQTARELPLDMQDEIARMIMRLAGHDPLVDVSPEDEAAVLASREAAARGDFATDEQMSAIRSKYGT